MLLSKAGSIEWHPKGKLIPKKQKSSTAMKTLGPQSWDSKSILLIDFKECKTTINMFIIIPAYMSNCTKKKILKNIGAVVSQGDSLN